MALLAVQMGLRRAHGRDWAQRRDDGHSRANSIRVGVMAAVVIVVSLTLQFLLYWQPFHLNWPTRSG